MCSLLAALGISIFVWYGQVCYISNNGWHWVQVDDANCDEFAVADVWVDGTDPNTRLLRSVIFRRIGELLRYEMVEGE